MRSCYRCVNAAGSLFRGSRLRRNDGRRHGGCRGRRFWTAGLDRWDRLQHRLMSRLRLAGSRWFVPPFLDVVVRIEARLWRPCQAPFGQLTDGRLRFGRRATGCGRGRIRAGNRNHAMPGGAAQRASARCVTPCIYRDESSEQAHRRHEGGDDAPALLVHRAQPTGSGRSDDEPRGNGRPGRGLGDASCPVLCGPTAGRSTPRTGARCGIPARPISVWPCLSSEKVGAFAHADACCAFSSVEAHHVPPIQARRSLPRMATIAAR